MAWKRGVANNQAGVIRKGQIREFLAPSSKQTGVSISLKVLSAEEFGDEKLSALYAESPYALFSSSQSDDEFNVAEGDTIYLHSHEHPRCVLSACRSNSLPEHCILLNEAQRVNSKVCIGETEIFTIYQGERFAYDVREGAIGDTTVRTSMSPIGVLSVVEVDVRLKVSCTEVVAVDADWLKSHLARAYFNCIVSLEELIAITTRSGVQVVCRISNVITEAEEAVEDEGEGYSLPDDYRGLVTASTRFEVISTTGCVSLPAAAPVREINSRMDIVTIETSDHESFPVRRRLLRPCIALTSIVQVIEILHSTHYSAAPLPTDQAS